MSARGRLAAVLLALVLPGATVSHWLLSSHMWSDLSLDDVPMRLDPFNGMMEEALDPEVLAELSPVDYVQRVYVSEEGEPVSLYAALYNGIGPKGAHSPTTCYPGQGWDITAQRYVAVPVPGGELTARAFIAGKANEKHLVLYWFQPADRWPGRELGEQLRRVYDALRGASQYVFVRLSAPYTARHSPDRELVRLAEKLAPHVRRALHPRGKHGTAKREPSPRE